MLRRLCYILFFTFLGFSLKAQNSNSIWKIYTSSDGLPSSQINDVVLEQNNRIWIATDSGLSFYNGHSFINYNAQNSNLPSSNIKELELVNSELYMISDSGLSKFDGRGFQNYNTQNGLIYNPLNSMAVDTNDVLWLASNRGVSRFDGVNFSHDSGKIARDIVIDDSNRVYILRYTVVFNIPASGLTIYEMYDGQNWISPPMNAFQDYYRSQFYKSPNGKIFLMPSGSGNQFYAELQYPFNLIKRPIGVESLVNQTPRFMKEMNSERWMNYWGVSSIYRSLAKDSVYNPMYLLPSGVRVNEMEADSSVMVIATDQGLLIGPSNYELPKFSQVLDVNQIRASMHVNGALFQNYDLDRPSFEYPVDSNTHLIQAANFQLGIKRDSTQGSFTIFPEEIYDQSFEGGPYHQTNKHFGDKYVIKINKTDIDNHILNYSQSSYQIPDAILNWPAVADSNLSSNPDLAPFMDLNNNGCYDPFQGEYPIIKGDQAIYWINHPQDKSIPLEFHWMLYGYQSSTDTALNRSVFVQLRIINRDTTAFNYIKPGFKVDAALGFPFDDFNGSDSSRNMIYFYNGDPFDDSFRNIKGYRGNPPAFGIRTLSAPSTSSVFYQTKISYPFSDTWNFLHGMEGDSTYFLNPFTSRTTRHQFSGDPFNNVGWTEFNLNPNKPAGNQPGPREGTIGFPAISLQAGQSETLELVINVAQKTLRTGIAEYLPLLRIQSDRMANFFASQAVVPSNYSMYFNCPLLVGYGIEVVNEKLDHTVYPNPTKGLININSDKPIQEIQICDLNGRIVQLEGANGRLQLQIRLKENLMNGIYILRYKDAKGWNQEKIIYQR